MKTLIYGLGAFGFAFAHYLSRIHPALTITGVELNSDIVSEIIESRRHPYFFHGVMLPDNVAVSSAVADISQYELIIIAVPSKFVIGLLSSLRSIVSDNTIILNVSKGLQGDNKTVSEVFGDEYANTNIHYVTLGGGMIADDFVRQKVLGADIAGTDTSTTFAVANFLRSESLDVVIKPSAKDIELVSSLKNIFAIMIGYYEKHGDVGNVFVRLLRELDILAQAMGGAPIDYMSYSAMGDIITTSFGDSRSRYLGNLLGGGMSISEAIKKLQEERKLSEGYELFSKIKDIVMMNPQLILIRQFYSILDM